MGKARRSVASRGEEEDDHGGVLRIRELRGGAVATSASSRRGEIVIAAAEKEHSGVRDVHRSETKRMV